MRQRQHGLEEGVLLVTFFSSIVRVWFRKVMSTGHDDREAFWTWGRTGPVTENVPDPFAGHYNTVSATKLNIYASFKPLESKLIDYSKKHTKQNALY